MGRILLRILFAQLVVYYRHITAKNNYAGWNASGLLAGEEKRLKSLNGGWRKVPSSVASGRRHKSIAWTTFIACFFLRVSTGMAGWGLVVHWDCLWQEPSWAEALFEVYPQRNKGDSLKLEMCNKATYHLHHCLCWLGFQFSRLGS